MEQNHDSSNSIEYIVGAEKGLKDIITEAEVMPLLKGTIRAGASVAMIKNAEEENLWMYEDERPLTETLTETLPLYLEGEPVGTIIIKGDIRKEVVLKAVSLQLLETVNIILSNNLKRMLTTETHTKVVNKSYEELIETNQRLSVSEAKYRDLVKNLEKKILERTKELKKAHVILLQQEKMASVGQLAAGLAHEINNPLSFILSNTNTLEAYVVNFKEMLDFYRNTIKENNITDEIHKTSQKMWKDLDLDYIFSDVEDLIKQSLDGAERVKNIVSDLKGFSHIDDGAESVVDINKEIDRTLNVLAHEIKRNDTEIIRDYNHLPGFTCNPARLCQVFFNIILNALQATKEAPKLIIKTRCEDDTIKISFSDNGSGIPENIRNRIFEPFYTTKDVGEGTGMGLTLAYEVITTYKGSIEVKDQSERGTTFMIMLPVME